VVNEEEQYFFDLMGYVVVEDVLGADEVAELNGLLDQYDFWRPESDYEVPVGTVLRTPNKVHVGNTYQWHEAFRRLMDHPRIMPYLSTVIGPTVRFDHDYVLLMKPGGEVLAIHGGAEPYEDIAVYHYQNGRMFNGLVVVSFALGDVDEGDGGFVAVPGSHKSNFAFPDEWRDMGTAGPWLRPVPQKAGSAIIFTEALAHGTAAWAAPRERRSVLLKFSPGTMSWVRSYPRLDDVPEASWSERQRALLEPPYFQNRGVVPAGREG
jgi:ectoine hydroxylase-related dioxygenase (phytanoyl-CoA dioxygenase family)